jgi:hypothetical protein
MVLFPAYAVLVIVVQLPALISESVRTGGEKAVYIDSVDLKALNSLLVEQWYHELVVG